MKTCSKCKTEKPLSEFSKDVSAKDGVKSQCRMCKKISNASYWQANQEKVAERRIAVYQANRLFVLARNNAYKQANKEKIAAKYRAYGLANKEKISAKGRAYFQSNRERLTAQKRAYNKANPEKRAAINRAYRQANMERIAVSCRNRRALKRNAQGTHSASDITRLMALQKGKCACCKKSIRDRHHVDHIYPLAKGGGNGADNLQLLCPTCNLQKQAKHPIDFMQQRGFLL